MSNVDVTLQGVMIGLNKRSKGGEEESLVMRIDRTAIAATILGLAMGLPSLGNAAMNQNSASDSSYTQASSGANSGSVDDATLKRTAAAYVKLRDISIKAEQAINRTDDTARKQQLMAESDSAKVEAMEEEGMEPQQYNNIISLLSDNSGLQQKFQSYVKQLRRSS
jgi:hypothetical protein